MKPIKESLIGLSSVALFLLTINCFADQYQGYISVADKLNACTPGTTVLPDRLFTDGKDTWVINGIVQGNCQFSHSTVIPSMKINVNMYCVFPMQQIKIYSDEVRQLAGPPIMNPPPSVSAPLVQKYCTGGHVT